jgi:hypothetical protein
MDFKEFGTMILENVEKRLDGEHSLEIRDYPKNNGVVNHGLTIRTNVVNLCPCIYLDAFYDRYLSGEMNPDEVAEEVVKIYRQNEPKMSWDTRRFTDYDMAKKNLRFHLINTEKNLELLETLPHRDFLDLSIIYTVDLPCDEGKDVGRIQVKNEHAVMWGVDEETLYQQATENMDYCDASLLENMGTVLNSFSKDADKPVVDCNEPMYVLSNIRRYYGAIRILDEEILKAAADLLGEDFIILPSSLHEVLLVPDTAEAGELENLVNMVREVNDTQVAEQEILSYHVYRYEGATGRITIAA